MPDVAPSPATSSPSRNHVVTSRVWLALGALGLAARFVLMALSIGCDDADIWLGHARTIDRLGMRFALETQTPGAWHYNHPPLMGYWAVASAKLAAFDPAGFARFMKLPGLFAELFSAGLIYRIWSRKDAARAPQAFAAYGLSLPLLFVSGYHCNTEPLYTAFGLLAFHLMSEPRKPFAAGLAMAGALNVKLIPLFWIPPLFALCRTRRDAILLAAGMSIAIVPFAPFLITSGAAMYRNMLAYNSLQADWGLMALLNHAAVTPPFALFFASLRTFCIETGRYWILGSVFLVSAIAFWRKRDASYELGALAMALFLVLTPGFGVQYSVAVLPLLVAVDIKRSVLYSLGAGGMLFFIYTFRMQPQLPLNALVQYFPCPVVAVECGILGWSVLASFVVTQLPKLWREGIDAYGAAPPAIQARTTSI